MRFEFIVSLLLGLTAMSAAQAEESFPTAAPMLNSVKEFCGAERYVAFLGKKDDKAVVHVIERSDAGLLQKTVVPKMADAFAIRCQDKTIEILGIADAEDENYMLITYALAENTTIDQKLRDKVGASTPILRQYQNATDHLVAGGSVADYLNGTIQYSCCGNRLELSVHNQKTDTPKGQAFKRWITVDYIEGDSGRVLNHMLLAKEEGLVETKKK